jgi:SAM-dependent methyltransferase
MGLARGAIALLMEEAVRQPFTGQIGTLGKQTILIDAREAARLSEKFGVKPGVSAAAGKSFDDQTLLKGIGFSEVHSIDYSNYEGATHTLDLNSGDLPTEFHESYDVILDSGTLEHVFHIPNVLKNIFQMLKPGGRVIFLAPSSNHVDHGFYMFSPTFFSDYYAANGFRVETACVVRYNLDLSQLWDVYDYRPGTWLDLSMGGLDERPYAIFFIATKVPGARWDAIPQQGYYADNNPAYVGSNLAQNKTTTSPATDGIGPAGAPPRAPRPVSSESALRVMTRKIPGARRLYHAVRLAWAGLSGASAYVPTGKSDERLMRKPFRGQY